MKKQIKKSLSLFMAVMMLLSCWVWVAPEKAEAGNITVKQEYEVEIAWNIADVAATGGNIKYKTLGDGWASAESSEVTKVGSLANENKVSKGDHSYSWTTTAFPTNIKLTVNNGSSGGIFGIGATKGRTTVKYVKINGKVVYDGGCTWTGNNTANMYPKYTDPVGGNLGTVGASNADGSCTGNFNWPRPMVLGFVDSTTADGTAININPLAEIGKDPSKGTTSFDISKYTFYDQYGVKVPYEWTTNGRICNFSYSTHIAKGINSSTPVEDTNIATDKDSPDTVVVKPELQISDPKADGINKQYYLVGTYALDDPFSGNLEYSRVSAPINITYPKYTVNFLNDIDATIAVGDDSYTKEYAFSGAHSATIAYPTKTEAEGYTFYDYWSKPQPTFGAANYNALTADFAKPCTTEDYTAYVEQAEGDNDENTKVVSYTETVGGKTETYQIVKTEDGIWYDAGKKLDPSTAKTIDVSENYANFTENWYGYWLSKDLTVKFYDVDGAFFGQKTVKSGQTQSAIVWPESKYSTYTSGAFTFTVDPYVWQNTDGTEIDERGHEFTKDLILTPKLTRKEFKDTYKVLFINPNNGEPVTVGTEGGTYAYRAGIKARADEALGKIAATPTDVKDDLHYSYELLGWSSVEPTTGKNYHVLLEDADFDANGTAIGLNSDWVVRSEVNYYAVYRRHTKTYAVDFKYKDATGTDVTRQVKVKYGATLVPPTDYVPYSYVTKGFGYTFNKWSYKTVDGAAELDYSATITFTSDNIEITGAALEGAEEFEPIKITATYGAPVATPYTVTFNYVDDKGEDVSKNVEVKNEEFILQGTVAALKPAEKWDHEDQLYTYANMWEITDGAATVGVGGAEKKVGDIIDTAQLISLTPTSNLILKAVYANPVPFYTVTYIDGAKTYTDRVLKDSNVPEWTNKVTNNNGTPDDSSDDFEEDKIYVPEDYKGDGGTYEFQGWYDEKQTDETFRATNGNKVTAADKVTGNLTLYSQFKFIPDTFTVKFMNYDGTVQLSAGKFEKGQNIEAITAVANKAAQGRAADDTYTYLFLGWDKEVPTFCEGHDVTFTAQYKPVYKYYDAKWYNSTLVDGEWVADENNLLATTHHTYNSKLYTPSVDNLTCLVTPPEEGQNYVFAGWYYKDAEGNAHKYERGMLITSEMEFYATYTLTDKVYTVTTVVRGEETEYSVASGDTVNIPDPQAGYVDADKHDAFDGWYTDAACTVKFDVATVITENTKIYAKFTEGEHAFTNKNVKTVPTYYAAGEMELWCSCDETKTKTTEPIAMLNDTKVPTGTIYLGGNSWSSKGTPAYETDGQDISIFVNEDTDVIITSNDTGGCNCGEEDCADCANDALYNPSGIGKGVRYIRAFAFPAETVLTAENYGAAQDLALDVYVDETEALTNNANFAVKLGDFIVADLDADGKVQYDDEGNIKYKSLESGESYIIYYYVTDKAGNQLNRKVRTAKFIYDNTDPVFTVDGESDGAVIPTYCGTATVEGIEKDAVLTVNGTPVNVKYEDGAETGTYEINYAEGMDNVIITATDKAGNSYSKKIKIAQHSYLLTKQEASCGVAGYEKEVCIICGDVKTDKTSPALDHLWSGREVIPADCVNIGSVVVTCEICGKKVTTQYEEDGITPVIPALGHSFEKDENGEIIYKTVTASTCKTNGLGEAYCTECNGELEGGYITTELALDPDNHEDITVTEVPADCIHNGYYTKACSCGKIIEHKDHETDSEIYAAKGHGETAWEIIKEASCYEPGTMVEKCTVCTAIITAETAYGYADNADGDYAYVTDEEGNKVEVDGKYQYYLVPATGEHIKILANPDTYKEEGVVKYKCATEGCPHKYDDKILENEELKEYTVKFLTEDGETVLATIKKTEGDYILANAVTAPTKASTVEYKYSFAGWVDADGKTHKLPLEVTKDMTLKASYKETKITYTHQFLVPTTWATTLADEVNTVEFAKLIGAYGDERVPSGKPVFTHEDADEDARLKALYTFEFKGWKNAEGVLVTDFTVSGDATFTAYFEAKAIQHEVIFYNGDKVIHTATVNAGASAEYNKYDDKGTEDTSDDVLIVPEKDYDDSYHYSFSGNWYTDPACADEDEYKGEAITGKTRLYAGFTATEHSYTVNTEVGSVVDEAAPDIKDGIVQKADCLLPELTEMICSCGHTKTEQTGEALGHDQYKRDENGDYVLVDGEKVENIETVTTDNGVFRVLRCSRCGEAISEDEVSVTVTFKHENGTKDYTVKLDVNADIVYETKPEKAATAQYTFEFLGWYAEGDATQTVVTSFGKADADKTFVAKYKETIRKYTVSYVDYNNDVIATAEIEYGKKVSDALTAPAAPVKPATENDHFTFLNWSVAADTVVTESIRIKPEYETEGHDFKKTGATTGATCTEPGGDVWACSCGAQKTSGGTPAIGHNYNIVVDKKDATYDEAGYIKEKCANCGDIRTREIPKREYKYITVTVKNSDGAVVEGAKVDLYRGEGEWVAANYTNADGVVTFKVGDENYKYSVLISGVPGLENQEIEVGAGENKEINVDKPQVTCSCSCHRPGFWGMLFRFFHKIISWFTGRISCCSCPDPKY
ncbi:MAG: InlB B-repeat-containing protein [Clostridia bacterium]|nr:InlB B-repeat-containing protein [Clostridia bacterium]